MKTNRKCNPGTTYSNSGTPLVFNGEGLKYIP